jgi:hypothetical protein
MRKTTIISAFPGMGTHLYFRDNQKILHLDANNFKFIKEENGTNSEHKHPDYPQNYTNEIKSNIGLYDYIFIDSGKSIRESLIDNCIFFFLVYPAEDRREEFQTRLRSQEYEPALIEHIYENWDIIFESLDKYNLSYVNVVVEREFPTISDVVAFIEKIKLNPEL